MELPGKSNTMALNTSNNVIKMPKILTSLEVTNKKDTQQSVLKRSANTFNGKFITIIPPSTNSIKPRRETNTKIILQGPNNKLVSLQIKNPMNHIANSLKISPNISKDLKLNSSKPSNISIISVNTDKKNGVTITKSLKDATNLNGSLEAGDEKPINMENNKNISDSDTSEVVKAMRSFKLYIPTNKHESQQIITANNKMINLQISNGKLSDPNGPIKMLSVNKCQDKGTLNDLEKSAYRTEQDPAIRVRSLETLIEDNSELKKKQPSLLKNKAIEALKNNPRLKARSKSLCAEDIKCNISKKRRLSSSSDGMLKKKGKNNIISPLTVDNTLICTERIDSSLSGSKEHSNESIGSLCSYSSIPMDIVKTEIFDVGSEEFKPIINSDPKMSDVITWTDGVGAMNESNLQFKLNEFKLIEVLTKRDTNRKSQIYMDTNHMKDEYICKNCNFKGVAVDFIEPEFCSRQCIAQYSTNVKAPKKYTNRKRTLNSKLSTKTSNRFSWNKYLRNVIGKPVDVDLFANPFPTNLNSFQIGMKLEAIDPGNHSLFCVCTVVDIKGYRIKLHFDGYSKMYDFWVNADSIDIFPPGWCSKTGRVLQPPNDHDAFPFDWVTYLKKTKTTPAPINMFPNLKAVKCNNPFKRHMKIEADDLRNTRKVCVATIEDVLENRILVHFDGWDESYNYWIDIRSPYIHPVNWHKRNGFSIVPPPEWEHDFNWKSYLSTTGAVGASEILFSTRAPLRFEVGTKLEVVDKKNPSLIRPSTVLMRDDYEIKVLFDGWPEFYAFWVEDDSPDLHPVGWCELTHHPLEPPPDFDTLPSAKPCPIRGCRGIGNAKHPQNDCHIELSSCPYLKTNWIKDFDRSKRVPADQRKYVDVKRKKSPNLIPCEQLNTIPLDNESNEIEKTFNYDINISRHLLCDYGPRLQQIHKFWRTNTECITKGIVKSVKKNPMDWNVDDVVDYIKQLPGCENIAYEFKKEEVNGQALLSLRQDDLSNLMNIKLGPSIKIYNQIVYLREEASIYFNEK